jgi:thymidylate synthase
MEIVGDSLDEVLIQLYEKLSKSSRRNKGTRGDTVEFLGVSLRLSRPRARISRSENRGKPFSALGELLWYLAGSSGLDFIQPYVPEYKRGADGGVLYGAYGPRLFAMRGDIDQLQNVTTLLNEKPGSRRAVVQLFNAEDISSEHKEIPCTTTLQFHLRDEQLHLSVTLRSNDAYCLPHDVFCFTMIQEMMARRLGVELGEYYHYVGSMHVYVNHLEGLAEYLAEGHQRAIEMPPMPLRDPFLLVPDLLNAEDRIRHGEPVVASKVMSESYWADIVRLLQVFWAAEAGRLDELKAEFASPIYRSYLEGRRHLKPRTPETRPGPTQGDALGTDMWPSRDTEKQRIVAELRNFNARVRRLPGLADPRALDTVAMQFVASLRREDYYKLVQRKPISANRADPNHSNFDAERAVAFHVQRRHIDEAAWLVFLMTYFARPEETGWLRLRDVYGRLGQGVWDWTTVSAEPAAFSAWLAANWRNVRGKFGNHRRYESLRPDSARHMGLAVGDYVQWIGAQGHQLFFAEIVRRAGNDPHTIFDALYREIKIASFGRLGKFDYLALIGRYGIAPISAGSAYLDGATGPLRGARLLFDGQDDGPTGEDVLQDLLDSLDRYLGVGMQVMEDALCNWQKSPMEFEHFRG